MPLDGGYGYQTDQEINRRLLIDELRREQPDFLWVDPNRCAMGIACRMGIVSWPLTSTIGPALGLSPAEAYKIFMTYAPRDEWAIRRWRSLPWWRKIFISNTVYGGVEPIHIADALEAIHS